MPRRTFSESEKARWVACFGGGSDNTAAFCRPTRAALRGFPGPEEGGRRRDGGSSALDWGLTPSIPGPPAAGEQVGRECSFLAVTADGTVYSNVHWVEGGGNASAFKDGEVLGPALLQEDYKAKILIYRWMASAAAGSGRNGKNDG